MDKCKSVLVARLILRTFLTNTSSTCILIKYQLSYSGAISTQDAPEHTSMEQLIQIAEGRDQWRVLVNSILPGEGEIEDEEEDNYLNN